jgi:putative oxidoreductase
MSGMKLGLLVLRVILGGLFIGHGAQKLFGSFGGHGPDGTGAFYESIGLRPGKPMALAAGASEAGGGALVALGLLTPLGATLISSTMLTAIWTVHRKNGLWAADGGYEYPLVVVALLLAMTDHGPGELSFDEVLGSDMKGPGWALLMLLAAALGSAGVIAAGSKGGAGGEPAATAGSDGGAGGEPVATAAAGSEGGASGEPATTATAGSEGGAGDPATA